jgi:hypothetical protein
MDKVAVAALSLSYADLSELYDNFSLAENLPADQPADVLVNTMFHTHLPDELPCGEGVTLADQLRNHVAFGSLATVPDCWVTWGLPLAQGAANEELAQALQAELTKRNEELKRVFRNNHPSLVRTMDDDDDEDEQEDDREGEDEGEQEHEQAAAAPAGSPAPKARKKRARTMFSTAHDSILVGSKLYSREQVMALSGKGLSALCAKMGVKQTGNKETKMTRLWLAESVQLVKAKAEAVLADMWSASINPEGGRREQFLKLLIAAAPWLIAYKRHFNSVDNMDFFLSQADCRIKYENFECRSMERVFMITVNNAHATYCEQWTIDNPAELALGKYPPYKPTKVFLKALRRVFVQRAFPGFPSS